MTKPLRKYFATFGTIHPYAGCYIEIDATDRHAAQFFMIDAHHRKWGMIFSEKEFEGQVEKLKLHRLAHFRQTDFSEDALEFKRVDEVAA